MANQESIYHILLKQREENPALPYVFQDIETAGREDTLFILLSEGVPYSQKEDMARECCDVLEQAMRTGEQEKLAQFLVEHPIRMFFIELRERLRVLVETGAFTQIDLHDFGMNLARNSQQAELVKLGIILLGFYPHDLTLKIFKVLGYHSDFTIYVSESIHHAHFHQNEILFDLVQHTAGYGRLAALFQLKPVTTEQQQWIVKHGVKSTMLSTIYVNVALQKTDIRRYLFETEIDAANYQDFMYIIAYQEQIEQKSLASEALTFMEKLVENREFANTFIDQAALVTIWLKVIDSWKYDYHYLDSQTKATDKLNSYWNYRFDRYEKLIRTIEVYLNKPKWEHTLLKEMRNPGETDYLVVNALQFLELKPKFRNFGSLLTRNPLGLNLLDFFLVHYPEIYFQDASDYLFSLVSEQLFELPLLFSEETEPDSSDLVKINMWLEALVKNMIEKDFFDIEWCIKLLNYYQPKLRRYALLVLRKYADEWEDDETVLTALETLNEIEENKKNKRLISRLLYTEIGTQKEIKYLPLLTPVKQEVASDIVILGTKIVGTDFVDLTVVEENVKKEKILQLVREPDNAYDPHAIAVTFDDGFILGYIPRNDNSVLATLMDNDEILFARFESEDLDDDDIKISVMLRKKNRPPFPDKTTGGNIVPFPQKR